ncbi:MAG TPA: DUF1801 domain-containing protein [bacterium]|jgi:hypothetical protein
MVKRASCGDINVREVDEYIGKLPWEQQELAGALRKLVLSASPRLEETIKWGKPWFCCGDDTVCYLAAQKDYINFGFARGAELADPDGLLEGSGKGMRHIKVKTMKDVRRRPLTALVKEAVKLCNAGKTVRRMPARTVSQPDED